MLQGATRAWSQGGCFMDKEGRFIGWLVFAIALIGSTYIAASSWVKVKTREVRTIEVTGSAKRRIVSDLIEWKASIETQGQDRTAAYKALHENVDKTMAYLKQQGIKDTDVRVSAVETEEIIESELVGSGDNRIEREVKKGWSTRQTIQVSSTEVDQIERVSREVTSLIEAGVPITSSAPAYFYTKLGELKIEMLAEASKDARTRAERMLASAGDAKLGKLHKADMGVINVNPANSTESSWDGNNDTTSLKKDIITIVHVSFDML
jgi:uncharacterized protein